VSCHKLAGPATLFPHGTGHIRLTRGPDSDSAPARTLVLFHYREKGSPARGESSDLGRDTFIEQGIRLVPAQCGVEPRRTSASQSSRTKDTKKGENLGSDLRALRVFVDQKAGPPSGRDGTRTNGGTNFRDETSPNLYQLAAKDLRRKLNRDSLGRDTFNE
jgi:hypothetical protein